MKLLGIDIETGSFDAETTFITEVAAVQWDTDKKQPIKFFSSFVNENESISEEATEYTGIDNFMIQAYGNPLSKVEPELHDLASNSDFLVGHNSTKFDKVIIDRKMPSMQKFFWIDTMVDIEYPKNCKAKNLTYLQAFHGFVNPFPHRALFDVCTMLKILDRYDLDKVVHNSMSPEVSVIAKFNYPHRTHPQYLALMTAFNETKEKVKKAGFSWNPEEKVWRLTTKQCFLDNMKFDFPTYVEGEV